MDRFWEFKKATKTLENNIDLGNLSIKESPQIVGRQLDNVKSLVGQMMKISNYGFLKDETENGDLNEEIHTEMISEGKF